MATKKRTPKNGSRKPKQATLALYPIENTSLAHEAQQRYLHYALSVITSRALPDVRDGLKPVQRRILYAMFHELRLRHDVKPRKCALVVGEVMGKYHPHGDTAIYDALARMAQDFSLRMPLVDGRGNFGSPDGDAPAAMRYTEAKLKALSEELLIELSKNTVAYRNNYDNTRNEPVVLPARFPNLLINGSQGIAVGMATSIPPHNLGEVLQACSALIDDPDLSLGKITKFIKGPDFPTGGEIVSTAKEIREVYKDGHGSLKLRGQWMTEDAGKGHQQIILTSIPYGIERRTIVSKVAEVIMSRKLSSLVDVRDESSDVCRVVLEIKKGTDPHLIMSYLYKHTQLASNVQVNLTCLTPTANPEVNAPQRLGLIDILKHFLTFRMEVVTKGLEHDLNQLNKRIHVLEGLEKIFDALDEVLRIIRKSEGKADAAQKLMKRFKLDEAQVEAILELKLYRLAQLEILLIRGELGEKRKAAKEIEKLLKSPKLRWKKIQTELKEIQQRYPDKRRTAIVTAADEPEFDAEAYIIDEEAVVLLSRQGWIKRQREVKDITSTRVRDGDQIIRLAGGSTRSNVGLFSNLGVCYVSRIADIPATTGYGDPVQKLFKLGDGERIIHMESFDSRYLEVPEESENSEEPEEPYALAITKGGLGLRFSLRSHRDVSTRKGRRYARLKAGDEILSVGLSEEESIVACASRSGHALLCGAEEIALLGGPGKGVIVIKLKKDDELVAARTLIYDDEALVVENAAGKEFKISPSKYDVVSRAGKGHALFKRGTLKGEVYEPPELPELEEDEEN